MQALADNTDKRGQVLLILLSYEQPDATCLPCPKSSPKRFTYYKNMTNKPKKNPIQQKHRSNENGREGKSRKAQHTQNLLGFWRLHQCKGQAQVLRFLLPAKL